MRRTLAENTDGTQGSDRVPGRSIRLILDGDERVAARRIEVLGELVPPVENVVPPPPDGPIATEGVGRSEVDHRIAVHSASLRLARLIETRPARNDLAAQGPPPRGSAQAQRAELLRAPGQHRSGRLVDGILKRRVSTCPEFAEGALVAELQAPDPRALQISDGSGEGEGIGDDEDDQVVDVVVEICGAEAVRSQLIADSGFLAERAFRQKIRIGGEATGRIDRVE